MSGAGLFLTTAILIFGAALSLALARGYFDSLKWHEQVLVVAGWVIGIILFLMKILDPVGFREVAEGALSALGTLFLGAFALAALALLRVSRLYQAKKIAIGDLHSLLLAASTRVEDSAALTAELIAGTAKEASESPLANMFPEAYEELTSALAHREP